jgi:hypothetical protein
VHVMVLVISLLMSLAPKKYLAGTNLFRRLMALRASILGPGPRYNVSGAQFQSWTSESNSRSWMFPRAN